jgi:plastocyanin
MTIFAKPTPVDGAAPRAMRKPSAKGALLSASARLGENMGAARERSHGARSDAIHHASADFAQTFTQPRNYTPHTMTSKPILAALALLASLLTATAQLIIPPADGTDLGFNPAANVEVDLSNAVPGDALTYSNIPGDAGRGIYDATRWVVVYKYSSVNIPAGVTVTFKNHPSHAPVVWLVQGSVNIAGTVSVNGKNGVVGTDGLTPTEPGPGGFRGGANGPSGQGAGLGPGGGNNGGCNTVYGNPQILPLIGGSGSSGANGASGASGGGAIMIAATGAIQITGSVSALRGTSTDRVSSGGAIKLIADSVSGTGSLNAATSGRVRIEANALAGTIVSTPSTIAVAPGTTPTLFPSAGSPTVKIVSVDGELAPADPTAPLDSSADIGIQKNTPVTIVLETRNFATAGAVVSVRIANKYGGASTVNAALQGGGTTALSTWTVNTTLAPGFVTLQARATQN